MRTIIFVVIMSAISTTIMHSQVLTRHLTSKQSMEEVIPFPINENYPVYLQPDVDFDQVLAQDSLEGSTIPRFAVKVEQNYTLKDGKQWQIGNMLIWQIGFSAPEASSLNFLISGLNLPEGAEMFILSKDGRIIHGPITGDVIYDHVYASDIIESQDVLMVVKCKKDKFQKFSIDIIGVCQGIPKPLETRDFGDAEDCNIDVNCPQGTGWENERDAVALVLKNGSWWCSGSLINNQCQDLRSYFLTAFHCFDDNEDRDLDNSEKNLSMYSFRFKYESGTPTCPGKSTGSQGNWIVYSGATFRAAFNGSDFALAELIGNISNQSRLAVAGWDRRNLVPQSETIIHHPSGDSKKITLDYNPAQQSIFKDAECWWLQIDVGATQSGSSGSPYFNQDKRIIAQHYGVNDANLPICNRANKFGGRFDVSWSGNNSDTTRLSTWLGPTNPPQTLNTIRVPSINSGSTSSFLICTTNKQIALSNAIPGRTITWSVNNTYLFATTNGAATSGSGAVATLRAANSTTSGSAVLTFTMSLTGCADVVVNQTIWVGLPDFNLIYNSEVCVGNYEWAFLDLLGPRETSLGTIEWIFNGVITGVGTLTKARFRGMTPGWGEICVKATNGCGERTKCFSVYVDYCGGGQFTINPQKADFKTNEKDLILKVTPTPFNNTVNINLSHLSENEANLLTIYDLTGKIIVQQNIIENNATIDMSKQTPGIYFIQYRSGNEVIMSKILKL